MYCYLSRRVSDTELGAWLEQRFPSHRFAINRDSTPDEVSTAPWMSATR